MEVGPGRQARLQYTIYRWNFGWFFAVRERSVMPSRRTLEAQIKAGTAKVKGDSAVLKRLASTMIDFNPRFEIMPGTKARDTKTAHADPYKAVPRKSIAE